MNFSIMLKSRLLHLIVVFSFPFFLSSATHVGQVIPASTLIADSVYQLADKMPSFPGGERALLSYIRHKVKYPAKSGGERASVIVQFVVDKKGKILMPQVLKGVSADFDKEALRVIRSMPKWIPGEQDSVKVSVNMIVPVVFRNARDSAQWEPNDKTVVVLDDVVMPAGFDMAILNSDKFAMVKIRKPFPASELKALKKKYGSRGADGVIEITTNKYDLYYSAADSVQLLNPEVASCKEMSVLPQFPGGNEKMMAYMAENILYPFVPRKTRTQGNVVVRFRVTVEGKIRDEEVVRPLEYFLDKEALRVVRSMPDWSPASKCGHKLDVFVTMPVTFKLPPADANKSWERNEKTVILLNGKRLPASFDLKLMSYAYLKNYQVLQPGTKSENKKLVSKYGKDAVNGVILIETEQ